MKSISVPTRDTEAPGYAELRRTLVMGSPAVLAGLLLDPSRLWAASAQAESDNDLERFFAGTEAKALALKNDPSAEGQDEYVRFVEEMVTNVNDVSQDSLSSRSWKGFDPGVYLGMSGRSRAFFVVHWRLAAGAFLPPHCHPKTSVITLGLEGAARLRHFEAAADAPPYQSDRTTEFLVYETSAVELAKGTTSTLTESRDNIHLFEAGPDGARGIDVTTDYGGDGSFSFLEFDHRRPEDVRARAFRARWIGTDL